MMINLWEKMNWKSDTFYNKDDEVISSESK